MSHEAEKELIATLGKTYRPKPTPVVPFRAYKKTDGSYFVQLADGTVSTVPGDEFESRHELHITRTKKAKA